MPPVLAVEVAGEDEGDTEESLRGKAAWYLAHGVQSVWIVVPRARAVLVVTGGGEVRCGLGDRLSSHVELPGLAPDVADFFIQITERA